MTRNELFLGSDSDPMYAGSISDQSHSHCNLIPHQTHIRPGSRTKALNVNMRRIFEFQMFSSKLTTAHPINLGLIFRRNEVPFQFKFKSRNAACL